MDAIPYLFACLLVFVGMFLILLLDPVEAVLCLIWVVALIVAALKDWSAVSRPRDPVPQENLEENGEASALHPH